MGAAILFYIFLFLYSYIAKNSRKLSVHRMPCNSSEIFNLLFLLEKHWIVSCTGFCPCAKTVTRTLAEKMLEITFPVYSNYVLGVRHTDNISI